MTKNEKWGIALLIAALFYNQFFGERKYQPQVGDSCGAGYHWVYVFAGIYGPELSCEED
jgi:hypothetical protein